MLSKTSPGITEQAEINMLFPKCNHDNTQQINIFPMVHNLKNLKLFPRRYSKTETGQCFSEANVLILVGEISFQVVKLCLLTMSNLVSKLFWGGRVRKVGLFFSVNLINAFTYFLPELGSPGENIGHLTSNILFTSQT